MRVTFRCDPALIDRLARPIPARQTLPEWLRNMPGTAWSALHDEDVRTVKHCPPFVDAMAFGFVIPLPCDVTMRRRRAVVGLGFAAAVTGSAPAVTDQLSRSCASDGDAVSRPSNIDREVQQLLDHRARARILAVCDSPRQSRRSSVSVVERTCRLRSFFRCRRAVPGSLDQPRILKVCCRVARRSRNVFRSREPRWSCTAKLCQPLQCAAMTRLPLRS